jgi:hypothetical protein
VTVTVAKRSAAIVAKTIVQEKLAALEHHALGEIQDWRDGDEEIVRALREPLRSAKPLPPRYGPGIYAAHAVAAAVMEALQAKADVARLMQRMLAGLKTMHDKNPSWGPLYVAHPGDVVAWRAYEVAGAAVEREHERRRREELLRSVENPHPESVALAEEGLATWGEALPEGDDELVSTRRSNRGRPA